MVDIRFPKGYVKHKYGKIHLHFIHDYFKRGGANLELVKEDDKVFCCYSDLDRFYISILVNGKQILINSSDHYYLTYNDEFPLIPIFKFHYYREMHDDIENVFPIGPMFAHNDRYDNSQKLNDYFSVRNNFNYNPGNVIMNKQRPFGNAIERRNEVRQILSKAGARFGGTGSQIKFWAELEKCLVSVCVPGAHNDMLDRGQYESIGLGVCTISPRIKTVMPWDQDLIPSEHYISCADDYSDLLEKVEWCLDNKGECKRIGDNARALFDEYCLPDRYLGWIEKTMEDFYG